MTSAAITDGYRIETANIDHVERIVVLWQSIDKENKAKPFGNDTSEKPQRVKELILHAIHSQEACVFICINNNDIIGTIAGHLYQKPAVRLSSVGVIYSLWIEPEHRKKGLASKLLSATEEKLKGLGAQALQVGWDQPNQYAGKWWQKKGYEPYEVIASKKIDDSIELTKTSPQTTI